MSLLTNSQVLLKFFFHLCVWLNVNVIQRMWFFSCCSLLYYLVLWACLILFFHLLSFRVCDLFFIVFSWCFISASHTSSFFYNNNDNKKKHNKKIKCKDLVFCAFVLENGFLLLMCSKIVEEKQKEEPLWMRDCEMNASAKFYGK